VEINQIVLVINYVLPKQPTTEVKRKIRLYYTSVVSKSSPTYQILIGTEKRLVNSDAWHDYRQYLFASPKIIYPVME
jgi:hypothetical protein